MRQKGKRGAVKKKIKIWWWTAGFIRCGVEGWVSSLKGPSSTKKNACSTPTNVCRMKIHINGYVRIMFQRGELSLDCILECVFFKDRSYQVKKERRDRRPSCLMNHELVWHHGSPYVR